MRTFILALLLTAGATAAADTYYVDDQLVITLRTGQGNAYQILRTLPSGTALEMLEQSDTYARVRTPDGVEGWVLMQYLSAQPIAKLKLAQAEQKLARLESENQQLKQNMSALKSEKGGLESEHKQLSGSAEKLQKELERLKEVAARPAELEKQNREMRQQLQALELETQVLKEENRSLRDRANRDWFLAGAGVLFGGLLLGLLLPKLRKRQGWGDWR